MQYLRLSFCSLPCLVWLALASPLWAASNIITSSTGYGAADRLSAVNPNGFDIFGDTAAVYADGHLELYNRNTWQPLYNLGDAAYGGTTTTYNSFVKFDPAGQSLWVGYTAGGNANDRIYQVTNLGATPTWSHVATLPANYDLAFSGTTPYVSGLNSTTWGGPNAIWRLDPIPASTQYQPTKIADIGGFAAGIAFDASGNLYYGTSFGAGNKLVEFTAQQVGEGGKTLANATVLSNLPFDSTDVSVDAAGHVLFTVNHAEFIDGAYYQFASTLGMWNGTAGEADNYRVIGSADANHWYTFVRTTGDVAAGGAAYLSDGGAWGMPVPGLAEIHHLWPGDADGDGTINGADLNTVLSNYNQGGMDWSRGDFNDDGTVNGADLNIVLSHYNETSGVAAAVPEPSTLILMAVGAFTVLAWRRRRVAD